MFTKIQKTLFEQQKFHDKIRKRIKTGTLKPLFSDRIPLWNPIIRYFKTWNFWNANIALQTEYIFIYLIVEQSE